MSALKSFRLPLTLLSRIEAIAKSKGVNMTAVVRFALERGVAAMEREAAPAAPTGAPEMQRRRVLSRGV